MRDFLTVRQGPYLDAACHAETRFGERSFPAITQKSATGQEGVKTKDELGRWRPPPGADTEDYTRLLAVNVLAHVRVSAPEHQLPQFQDVPNSGVHQARGSRTVPHEKDGFRYVQG